MSLIESERVIDVDICHPQEMTTTLESYDAGGNERNTQSKLILLDNPSCKSTYDKEHDGHCCG